MRPTRIVAILALIWSGACWALHEGAAAPPLKVSLLDGSTFTLADAAGKVVVINFWATWCTPCLNEMPAMDAYYRRHRQEGLVLIAVSMDESGDEAKVRKAVSQYSFPVGLYSKSDADGYGRIWHTPLTFVIDRKKVLRKDGWSVDPFIDERALDTVVTPLLNSH